MRTRTRKHTNRVRSLDTHISQYFSWPAPAWCRKVREVDHKKWILHVELWDNFFSTSADVQFLLALTFLSISCGRAKSPTCVYNSLMEPRIWARWIGETERKREKRVEKVCFKSWTPTRTVIITLLPRLQLFLNTFFIAYLTARPQHYHIKTHLDLSNSTIKKTMLFHTNWEFHLWVPH